VKIATLHRSDFVQQNATNTKTNKEFMAQFNREKITIEDLIEDMTFAAIYQGISSEDPLMKKLI
jgi:hypothetical protein